MQAVGSGLYGAEAGQVGDFAIILHDLNGKRMARGGVFVCVCMYVRMYVCMCVYECVFVIEWVGGQLCFLAPFRLQWAQPGSARVGYAGVDGIV